MWMFLVYSGIDTKKMIPPLLYPQTSLRTSKMISLRHNPKSEIVGLNCIT